MAGRVGEAERGSGLTQEQRQLVEMGLPLVEECAGDIARRYSGIIVADELLAPGALGLDEAARAFREDRHPSFLHYARHHIRGRMLDAVRSEHFSLRARVEHAMERAFARISAHQTLGVDLFSDEDAKLLDGARSGCEDVLAAAFVAGALEAERESPEDAIVEREEYARAVCSLRDAVTALPPHERQVMDLVYEQGMTLDEVGREVRVHANTAQRRHISALRRLRSTLLANGTNQAPAVVDCEEAG